MVSHVTCLTPLSDLVRQQCPFCNKSVFFWSLNLTLGELCDRTQGSKPLNIAFGNVQSFEINGCTVLSLTSNRNVVGGNCMISKGSFMSKL